MVVFGQLFVLFRKICCMQAMWLYSGNSKGFRAKVVVFGRKWKLSGKGGCIRERRLHSGKVVIFGHKWLYSCKVVVFGQK